MEQATEERPRTRVKFLKAFKELFNPVWRFLIYYGGRNSGKTRHVAEALLIRGRKERKRILCTRELQNTIKDSVHKELKDLIEEHGYVDYKVYDEKIINTVTGTEFIFKGLRHNATEIKSMANIDICWVEEAQKVSEASLDILVPTIRKAGSQLIFTYNRVRELDPVHVKYVLNRRERTYVKKVDYTILEKHGLLSDEIRIELEADRKNPSVFAHIWGGEPIGQAEMAVLSRDAVLAAMEREVEGDGAIIVGVDVARMGDDRTVFWMRKGLKTIKTQTHTKLKTTQVCDALEQFVDFNKVAPEIRVDDTGVGGGVTDEMQKRGYKVIPINFGGAPNDTDKYPNWISEAWFHIGEILDEAQLPYDSELLTELTAREWKQDNKGKRAVQSKQEFKKSGMRSPDLADACIICYGMPKVQPAFRMSL